MQEQDNGGANAPTPSPMTKSVPSPGPPGSGLSIRIGEQYLPPKGTDTLVSQKIYMQQQPFPPHQGYSPGHPTTYVMPGGLTPMPLPPPQMAPPGFYPMHQGGYMPVPMQHALPAAPFGAVMSPQTVWITAGGTPPHSPLMPNHGNVNHASVMNNSMGNVVVFMPSPAPPAPPAPQSPQQ
jgi:hypothetical protein